MEKRSDKTCNDCVPSLSWNPQEGPTNGEGGSTKETRTKQLYQLVTNHVSISQSVPQCVQKPQARHTYCGSKGMRPREVEKMQLRRARCVLQAWTRTAREVEFYCPLSKHDVLIKTAIPVMSQLQPITQYMFNLLQDGCSCGNRCAASG